MRMLQYIIALILVVTVAPVFAQPSERVRQLEQEINFLKNTVADQGRRIELLERQLLGKPSATGSSSSPAAAQFRTPSSVAFPWHDKNAWDRVKHGMSEAQVVSILGPPTSVNVMGSYRTLLYRGDVPGSGSVSGNVMLTGEDRVLYVNTPVF